MNIYIVEGLRVLGIIEEGRALSVEENLKKTEIVSELKRSTFMEEVFLISNVIYIKKRKAPLSTQKARNASSIQRNPTDNPTKYTK
jgi:hypothetical protein